MGMLVSWWWHGVLEHKITPLVKVNQGVDEAVSADVFRILKLLEDLSDCVHE